MSIKNVQSKSSYCSGYVNLYLKYQAMSICYDIVLTKFEYIQNTKINIISIQEQICHSYVIYAHIQYDEKDLKLYLHNSSTSS